MKEIINEVEEEKYNDDYSFLLEYDKEALDEAIRQDELKKAHEESYNEGFKTAKKEIINKLKKMDILPKELEKLEDLDYTDDREIPTYDKEALDEAIRQDELKKAREESYNEGIRNNKIEITKKLLEMNIPKKDIEKAIGTSLEKLENPDYTDEIKIPTYNKEVLDEEIRQDELKKAKEESYNEGITNEKREIAQKMILKGLDVNEISEITGLTKEELLKIK